MATAFGCCKEKNGWTLTYGIPPHPDPMNLVYEGHVELTGWLVCVPSYVVGTEDWHFHVAEESRKYLPEGTENYEFQIDKASEGLIFYLMPYSENYPAKVVANEIVFFMEGKPSIEIGAIIDHTFYDYGEKYPIKHCKSSNNSVH